MGSLTCLAVYWAVVSQLGNLELAADRYQQLVHRHPVLLREVHHIFSEYYIGPVGVVQGDQLAVQGHIWHGVVVHGDLLAVLGVRWVGVIGGLGPAYPLADITSPLGEGLVDHNCSAGVVQGGFLAVQFLVVQ